MGIGIILFTQLFCKPVVVRADNWNEFDAKTLFRAASHCYSHHYNTGNPCLVRFTKHKERTYRAICGGIDERR